MVAARASGGNESIYSRSRIPVRARESNTACRAAAHGFARRRAEAERKRPARIVVTPSVELVVRYQRAPHFPALLPTCRMSAYGTVAAPSSGKSLVSRVFPLPERVRREQNDKRAAVLCVPFGGGAEGRVSLPMEAKQLMADVFNK